MAKHTIGRVYKTAFGAGIGAFLTILIASIFDENDAPSKYTLVDSVLGISVEILFQIFLVAVACLLFAHYFIQRSRLFITNRLNENDLLDESGWDFFDIYLPVISLAVMFAIYAGLYLFHGVPVPSIIGYATLLMVVCLIYPFYIIFPYVSGERYFITSESDSELDIIEEKRRLEKLQREKAHKQQLDDVRKKIEEKEYEIKTLDSEEEVKIDRAISPVVEEDTNEPQTLESVIEYYNKQIEIIEMAERKELEGVANPDDLDGKRRLSTIRTSYQRMKNDASNELQAASKRVLRETSPLKGKRATTFDDLERDYEISLETLDQYRVNELRRINKIENPSERDKAKNEFLVRHANMKTDIEAQHESSVKNMVRRKQKQ